MGFSDRLSVADGITIALSCGFCNQPAPTGHICGKRYLREARIVHIQPSGDDYLVRCEGEQYTINRETLEREYAEL